MAARLVEFNALPRNARERLLASLGGRSSPAPLLASESPYKGAIVGWSFLALGGALLLIVMLTAEFGRRLQGGGAVVGYALAFAAMIGSALAIVRRVRVQRSLPFKPGRYLLPMDFVDARSSKLRLVPMNTLVDFRGVHHHTNGGYTGTHLHFTFEGGVQETFVVRGKQLAEQVLAQLRQSQAVIQRAAQERDIDTIYALDPLLEVRVSDAWGDGKAPAGPVDGPAARPVPALFAPAAMWGLAGVVGLAVGVPTWLVRNHLSDEAMFQSATRSGSVWELEDYARNGRAHVAEVNETLLPKAALAEAQRKGSVTALREFLAKYPKAKVADEARASIHALFQKTLRDFRAEAADDPRLVPFMEKLVGFLEAHESSRVDVRFYAPSTASLEIVDKLLAAKGARIDGNVIPIAPHFDVQHDMPREARIVSGLQGAFAAVFPADIMRLETGPRLEGDPIDPPALAPQKAVPGKGAKATKPATPAPARFAGPAPTTAPALDVKYAVRWAGDFYSEEKGTRKFVGIVVQFDVAMRVPGDAETYDFSLEVRPPETFSVQYDSPYGTLPGIGLDNGPSEGMVYDVMATRAFDQLTTKLGEVFFRAGSKARLAPPAAEPKRPPLPTWPSDLGARDVDYPVAP